MSNWLDPACARAAMAIGRPAIETAAACAEVAVALCVVAVLVARMPKLGKLAVAADTALVALCEAEEVPPLGAVVSICAVIRFAAGAAVVLAGATGGAGACWGEELSGGATLAARSAATAPPAAVFVVGVLPSAWLPG